MFKRYVYFEGLASLVGSDGQFLINVKGQIKDCDGNDLLWHYDSEGHRVVKCVGWDGEKNYRIIDLMAIQFKNLQIPHENYCRVIAFVIDRDKDNTHAANIGYRFKNSPLEVREYPGFYYVPSLTALAINREGIVIRTKNFSIVPTHTAKGNPEKNIRGGYKNLGAFFDRNRPVTVGRHRLLCLTFKEYPDNVDELTVNHIDGIPGNDNLDNLEWVTRSENNTHAYKTFLKNQNLAVLVRNVLTGEVVEYYSISECARALGYSHDETIRSRICRSKFGTVFQDGTQIKLKNDPRPWIIPKNATKEIEKSREKIPVIARNCLTLEERFFGSIKEAAKEFEIIDSTLSLRIGDRNKKPLCGWQFKEELDKEPWPAFTEKEYLDSLKPNSFAVNARNIFSGVEVTYKSIREAQRVFGGSIREILRKKSNWLSKDGWQLKLEDCSWEFIEDPEEAVYKIQKEIMAKSEETGQIYIAENAAKMAGILNLDPKEIRRAAFTRGNRLYKNYRFRLGITNDPWPLK